MRHLLLQQLILQAIPICKFIGGRLEFINSLLDDQTVNLYLFS